MPTARSPLHKAFALVLISVSTACATPGPILTESVSSLRSGAAMAAQQSNETMLAANRQSRERALAFKIRQPAMSLAESDFPTAVAPDDVLAWQQAFSVLDSYLAALQGLVDPRRSTETADNIAALGDALANGPLGLKLPAGLRGLFAVFGGALVQNAAEKKATRVMANVDPAFQAVLQGMADAIGADDQANLRGTVRTNWERSLSEVRLAYARIGPAADGTLTDAQIASRQKVAEQFLGALESRAGADLSLSQLRMSMLALAEAHHSAAAGRPGDALFWINRISGWLDDVQARIAAAEEADEAEGK
jgi:hypothetical protein